MTGTAAVDQTTPDLTTDGATVGVGDTPTRAAASVAALERLTGHRLPAGARTAFYAAVERAARMTPEERAAERARTEREEARAARAENIARRAEMRAARYAASVPALYQDARVDQLRAEQNPGGRVRAWWTSGSRVLVLQSETSGNGKTHAAYAVGWEASADGANVCAWTMADLNEALRPSGTDPDGVYRRVERCDLLIIDDLGREKMTEWTVETLQRILDARLRDNKRLIVTTNLTGKDLVVRYGGPVADRLKAGLTHVEVVGQSQREVYPW